MLEIRFSIGVSDIIIATLHSFVYSRVLSTIKPQKTQTHGAPYTSSRYTISNNTVRTQIFISPPSASSVSQDFNTATCCATNQPHPLTGSFRLQAVSLGSFVTRRRCFLDQHYCGEVKLFSYSTFAWFFFSFLFNSVTKTAPILSRLVLPNSSR